MRIHSGSFCVILIGVALTTLAIRTTAALGAPPPYPGAPGVPFGALQSQIDAINADIATLQAQLNSINAQITDLQAATANLQAQIATNTGDIGTLQSQVASNTLVIGTLQATAAALQNQINLLNATKQNTIWQSCPPKWSIRAVLPSGGVICEFDDGEDRASIFSEPIFVLPGVTGHAAHCPDDFFATGGGYFFQNFNPGVFVIGSFPQGLDDWVVFFNNTTSFPVVAFVNVMCVRSL